MFMAFEVTAEDIETVLRDHQFRLETKHGEPFGVLAEQIFNELSDADFAQIEKAALDSGTDLDEQTTGAHQEIALLLEREGWLKPHHISAPSP